MNQETLDKMRRMRLFGMYHAFKSGMETPRSEPYTADEMTSMLIESEWDDRHNRALDRGLRNAKFRYKATIEQVENVEQRGIDKNQLHRLAALCLRKPRVSSRQRRPANLPHHAAVPVTTDVHQDCHCAR